MAGDRDVVALSEEQQKLLNSPLREAILELLVQKSPLTAQEIAAELDTNRRGIYYHLELLQEAGLVNEVKAPRSKKTKKGAYVAAVKLLTKVGKNPDSKFRSVRTSLRMLERQHRKFFKDCGDQPQLLALSTLVWGQAKLSDTAALEVVKRVQDLHQFVKDNHDEEGQRMMLMGCTLPILNRSRKK